MKLEEERERLDSIEGKLDFLIGALIKTEEDVYENIYQLEVIKEKNE